MKKDVDVGSESSSKFEKGKDEEDEPTCLIEEMQRNFEAAQKKSYETEYKLYRRTRTEN